ncbi:hypothetical protein PAESOLCIP111_04165 [Paenibacillus solanacearum]|uniref:Uncharacterized protein n=1 Tax=Paenibacillus solanacearum TaxID=2048548 RepID=A0A916NY81_9BACL|nr:hypothetical protein PAESOLCIP111_04165 [Paenibacillus solanacearum]
MSGFTAPFTKSYIYKADCMRYHFFNDGSREEEGF